MRIGDPNEFLSQLDQETRKKMEEQFGKIDRFLKPGDTFRFECDRTGRCCKNRFDNLIMLSPYDVMRLRRRLKISSGEFLRRYAHLMLGADSQLPLALLRYEEEKPGKNRCPFLRSYGCAVYPDRPLRCRLYPVGRAFGRQDLSYFFLTDVPSHCGLGKGRLYTLEEWLEEAEAEPFLDWSDEFFSILWNMDHERYRSLDEKLKLNLAVMIYDFDKLISRMVEDRVINKPKTDEEILSIVVKVFKAFTNSSKIRTLRG